MYKLLKLKLKFSWSLCLSPPRFEQISIHSQFSIDWNRYTSKIQLNTQYS